MAVQRINKVEKGIVIFLAVVIDTIGLIPVLGSITDLFGLMALNVYFFIKLGTKYLGGRRSGQKIANTLISAAVAIIPFVPELTVQAVTMFWILDKEAKEEAEEAAKKSAANANFPRQKLSRAA